MLAAPWHLFSAPLCAAAPRLRITVVRCAVKGCSMCSSLRLLSEAWNNSNPLSWAKIKKLTYKFVFLSLDEILPLQIRKQNCLLFNGPLKQDTIFFSFLFHPFWILCKNILFFKRAGIISFSCFLEKVHCHLKMSSQEFRTLLPVSFQIMA